MKTHRSIHSIAFAAIAGLLAAGCASTSAVKTSGTTSTSLHDAAQSVTKSNAQIDPVLGALSNLVNNPETDSKAQYATFSAAVTELEKLAAEVSSNASAMQAQGAAYFVRWDEELAKIHNEDIRTRSVDRRNEVMARFDRVKAGYAQTTSDFQPFLSDLKDIRTMLGVDLTRGGVASIRNVANRATGDAKPLRSSLEKLAADFESLGVSLAAPVATTK